ncbi:hypothetical protein ACFL27_27830 [candidate division CSSED10-310 bacterium]|uniref:Uncharacterized protein n=1 Tax=candidate division CSSED10-310 bacterium TaxID=2855610 RepID=A0ABV6Z6E7_UNCC1
MVKDHLRHRKTGPTHPLLVVRCQTHTCGFTLYPPGYTPYGREAVVTCDLSGHFPLSAPDETSETWSHVFKGTYFEAGLDAAIGKSWHRECPDGTDRWWPTQIRRLGVMIRWLGVDPVLDEEQREEISVALEVGQLLLNECCQMIMTQPGYRSRGQAVQRILSSLAHRPCLIDRLLLSGHLTGLWGVPYRCDTQFGMLRSPSFLKSGTRSPPI